MTKYTILKVFEKKFSQPVWKIVVDEAARQLAVELRDPKTTAVILYVFDFDGKELLTNKQIDEKEWTLEALQQGVLILKRVGDTQPIKEGLWLLDIAGNTRQIWQEYTWIDTYNGWIKVRHRNFQSGFEEYIDIVTGTRKKRLGHAPSYCHGSLKMPIPYNGEIPSYLRHLKIQDLLWISRTPNLTLWSYHQKDNEQYHLNLAVTDSSELLWTERLLSDMPKMIPQPFMQIDHQLFLLSYNKQKIVSYLV